MIKISRDILDDEIDDENFDENTKNDSDEYFTKRLLKKAENFSKEFCEKYEILNKSSLGDYFLGLIKIGDTAILTVDNLFHNKNIAVDFKISKNGYSVKPKNALKKPCPKFLLEKLLQQGLYASEETTNSNNNSRFSLHRLCLCMSENISGLQVHHIDKNRQNNSVINLLGVTKEEHDKMHPEIRNKSKKFKW